VVTFLSDFGVKDGYVAQMKGAVSNIASVQMVDITHDISAHNIREGAFVLQNVVPYFPVGTVHVAVVDPGVGTDRRGIVITTSSQVLIGPDNGLLIPAARILKDFTVYEITNKEYFLKSVSNTFHGRDIFSPVAAHIVKGAPFDTIGNKIDDFVDLDFGRAEYSSDSISGNVVYIDNFGNIVTNISGVKLLDLFAFDTKLQISISGKKRIIPLVRSYGFVKKNQLLGTVGSSNFFELGINQGSAVNRLKLKEGDEITLLSF